MNGTSMAAPQISGILALYKENYPTFGSRYIENMLYEQAEDLGTPRRDIEYGYGLASAIPPKHFEIEREISLNKSLSIHQFPKILCPQVIAMN
jgi:subtilisin